MATDESDTLELVVRDDVLIVIFPLKGLRFVRTAHQPLMYGLETTSARMGGIVESLPPILLQGRCQSLVLQNRKELK